MNTTQRFQDTVVLVTGATGGLGKRVVQRLLLQGRHVRALVRDVSKAKQLLVSVIGDMMRGACAASQSQCIWGT